MDVSSRTRRRRLPTNGSALKEGQQFRNDLLPRFVDQPRAVSIEGYPVPEEHVMERPSMARPSRFPNLRPMSVLGGRMDVRLQGWRRRKLTDAVEKVGEERRLAPNL